MSEEQKKRYEEDAELHIKNVPSIHSNLKLVEKLRFIEGTEHAHPIGFNLALDEVEKAVDELNKMFSVRGQISYDAVIEILKKLRK